jgi:hypothetical protein
MAVEIEGLNETKERVTAPSKSGLAAESERCDEAAVPFDVLALQVVQKATPLAHQHQESTPTVMIVLMSPQMVGEVSDSLSDERNLDLG